MHQTLEHINTGNSAKLWIAIWQSNGEPVRTASGDRTLYRCGSREAESIERQYHIYLSESTNVHN